MKVLFGILVCILCVADNGLSQINTNNVSKIIHIQQSQLIVDSLKQALRVTNNDTQRLVLNHNLSLAYESINLDSSLFYAQQMLPAAQRLNDKLDEAFALDMTGFIMNELHHESTLETLFKGVNIAEEPETEDNILPEQYLRKMTLWNSFITEVGKNKWSPHFLRIQLLGALYDDLGNAYGNIMANQQKLLFYASKAIDIYRSHKDTAGVSFIYKDIADFYKSINQYDSCLFYAQRAAALQLQIGSENSASKSLALVGSMHFEKGNDAEAINLSRQAIQINTKYGVPGNWLAYYTLSEYFFKSGIIDSSLYYAREAYRTARQVNLPTELQNISTLLARLYKKVGNKDSALAYFELASALNESNNNADKRRKIQSQDFDEQMHQQEVERAKIEYRNKVKVYSLVVGLGALIIIALLLLRNNQQRKKTNTLLDKKNKEIESTLYELKATQSQLIQSEKMASLGQLTAGIAHEIQNPLNFVNNFSEINTELIEELEEEAGKGNINEVKAIAKDLRDNEQKIIHHGKRADSIVKGMLQHSRASTGKRELTDINALVDECVRLSYHGMRAKDKAFNAAIKTELDESLSADKAGIGKVNIIPQDISRVMLNLLNNAFYAVDEKKRQLNGVYEPAVSVCTKKLDGKVEIHVNDNGNGIPQNIVDKIFQPFFTTKPTGQGTGLGLSLSYDIVKAHGGELRVESKDGEGSEFIIQLLSDQL